MSAAAPHTTTDAGPGRPHHLGLAGRMARAFIESPLTPLLLLAFFLIGALGMMVTPREEDPQISVPMVDIMIAYPGASSQEVANLVAEPLERLMSELPGVKHVYSMSRDGMAMVTVRFDVGEQMEPSLVKLYDKLYSHMDAIPKGVMQPIVKPKSIDDVPVVTITLSSSRLDLVQLRKLGLDVVQRFKALPNTGQSFVVGGSEEQVRIDVDLARLAAHNVSLGQIARAVAAANQRIPAGDVVDGDRRFNIYTGEFLANAHEVENLLIAVDHNRPVYLRDVATVQQGEGETRTIVTASERLKDGGFATNPAVTIAVAKKHGSNGIDVAHALTTELDALKGSIIPDDVTVTLSRNYGETAQDKVTHLIIKLFIVSALVTLLALVTMGGRPALIVMVTIPAVLLMSLAVAYVLKFTINRVSMFALVFAIGILVDDAIVVVENIYRRWLDSGSTDDALTVEAVDEVGNPTILATFTVVAALLPMGFVSDMMGPYMLPIPVLSSAAMIFSLFAAFIFVPWLAARVKPTMAQLRKAAEREHKQSDLIGRFYGGAITPIMSRTRGLIVLALIILAMFGAIAMFPLKLVPFKMLPYDNKSELQVVIDMPEGSDLFATANLAQRLASELQKQPELLTYQTYVGTSSPFNFNGLVRHYFLRSQPWQADIAVQLLDKSERERSSHDIASAIRASLTPIAAQEGARLTIAEAPPGPPVLAPLVVELYGPSAEIRRKVAGDLFKILRKTPDVADVNTFIERPHSNLQFIVDTQRASMFGVSTEAINREIAMATGGFVAGAIKSHRNLEQTVITLQTPMAARGNLGNLLVMPVHTETGQTVPLGELGQFVNKPVDPVIFHKDLRPLEYVTADVVGRLGAPLYGMLNVDAALKNYVAPDGTKIGGSYFGRPADTTRTSFKWDGEWEVTYVTFRDMGLAFIAALVLIYILVVAEFKSFMLPAVVMAPIPLTLIGIVPGHWLLGADFTATSMIGFIALAGIIVRNSILLVEFSRAKVAEGWSVRDAIVMAGRVRLRPILITALALVIGSMVLLSDPIFQGMAVSLLFGSLIATFLTLVVIPLGCVAARKYYDAPGGAPQTGPAPDSPSPGPAPGSAPAGAGAASARPPRLQKRGETAGVAASAGEAALAQTAAAGRPPRLMRKSDADAPETTSALVADAPAPAGRPPRLMRKSEADHAPPAPSSDGRPPRLLRKSEAEAAHVASLSPDHPLERATPPDDRAGPIDHAAAPDAHIAAEAAAMASARDNLHDAAMHMHAAPAITTPVHATPALDAPHHEAAAHMTPEHRIVAHETQPHDANAHEAHAQGLIAPSPVAHEPAPAADADALFEAPEAEPPVAPARADDDAPYSAEDDATLHETTRAPVSRSARAIAARRLRAARAAAVAPPRRGPQTAPMRWEDLL
ncbi:MAG: efflux RND transporter permease subunit [Hyphomicrobiales bacterium]|nr:efflux RND transporter permease subunit [Hyphomicrobiales bacterium]